MSLASAYTVLAPFYDRVVSGATRPLRQASLAHLPAAPADVLLVGVGTGLDLPHLPAAHRYTGVDFNAAMLARSRPRASGLDFVAVRGDAMKLPFADACFDCAVLHLIVAVVPDGRAVLQEAARVLRPGGQALLLDKFLRRGRPAPLRRLLSPLAARVATRLDVVLEDALDGLPFGVVSDDAAAFGGWFRQVRLLRT
ncbi:class I SAM-dependent methyltransferase [Methyloversatilis thermotolerans]|uniref:class I SAM-dependent methyltransferase n=1 Tax=Methyloversatilis thermotolerans TaxID=1346290 RepID=UPI000376E2A6|nr:class I SAM-dependent methyltransferase [Methyloversatilis thermotolerans]